MELHLHMQPHRFARRAPDWRAAAIAGLIAGTLYVVLELLTARFVLYQGAWGTVKMVAALMLGREALASADAFSWTIVLAAGIVHFGLSIVLATILAMLIASFRFDSSIGMATLVGAVFGVLVYLVNFYVMGRYFNWFDEARGLESLFAHIMFGVIAADAYAQLERRREPDAPGMARGG